MGKRSEPTVHVENLIQSVSAQIGVDPDLVRAHMKRESAFDEKAVREEPQINDASIGLMQVLVKTAQWIMADQSIGRKELFEPTFNIRVGATYIKRNLTRYGGNVEKAIASYNAGSARYKSDKKTFINQVYVDFVYKWYQIYKKKISLTMMGLGVGLLATIIGGLILLRREL